MGSEMCIRDSPLPDLVPDRWLNYHEGPVIDAVSSQEFSDRFGVLPRQHLKVREYLWSWRLALLDDSRSPLRGFTSVSSAELLPYLQFANLHWLDWISTLNDSVARTLFGIQIPLTSVSPAEGGAIWGPDFGEPFHIAWATTSPYSISVTKPSLDDLRTQSWAELGFEKLLQALPWIEKGEPRIGLIPYGHETVLEVLQLSLIHI